jgi:hypothetical protein
MGSSSDAQAAPDDEIAYAGAGAARLMFHARRIVGLRGGPVRDQYVRPNMGQPDRQCQRMPSRPVPTRMQLLEDA